MSNVVTFKVDPGFQRQLKRLGARSAGVLSDAAMEGAEAIRDLEHIVLTTGRRSGRSYEGHRASAPGEPPARDTGELADSLEVRRGRSTKTKATAYTGTNSDHGEILERGTSSVAARPFARVVIDEHVELIGKVVGAALRRGIARAK